MALVKIRLLKDYCFHEPGYEYEEGGGVADILVLRGIAEYASDDADAEALAELVSLGFKKLQEIGAQEGLAIRVGTSKHDAARLILDARKKKDGAANGE